MDITVPLVPETHFFLFVDDVPSKQNLASSGWLTKRQRTNQATPQSGKTIQLNGKLSTSFNHVRSVGVQNHLRTIFVDQTVTVGLKKKRGTLQNKAFQ